MPRRFDSFLTYVLSDLIAQLAEQKILNLTVVGSSPTEVALKFAYKIKHCYTIITKENMVRKLCWFGRSDFQSDARFLVAGSIPVRITKKLHKVYPKVSYFRPADLSMFRLKEDINGLVGGSSPPLALWPGTSQ